MIEGSAAGVISNIIRTNVLPQLSSADHRNLLRFAVFQRSRTVYAAEEMDELLDKVVKILVGRDPDLKDHMDEFKARFDNPALAALDPAVRLWPMASDLKSRLIVNDTEQPFITSDAPAVFYNQLMEKKKTYGSNTGLQSKGLQIFLPLSPRHCLVLYDGEVYKLRGKGNAPVSAKREKDIAAVNALQCVSVRENLYFDDRAKEKEIRRLVQMAGRFRRKAKARAEEYEGPTDAEGMHSLLHTYKEDVRCDLSLSLLKVRRKAKKYELGDKAVHVRNEEICRLYDDAVGGASRPKREPPEGPYVRRRPRP